MSLFDDDLDQDEFDEAEDKTTGAPPLAPEPRCNPELLGFEETEQQLVNWWAQGTLPHTLVLAGPHGIGKATLAYRLARFVLATPMADPNDMFGAPTPPKSLAVAPANPVFMKVASGGHPDLMTIGRLINEKTGLLQNEIVVETAREIPGFLRHTPAEGGWRVVIIDEAETLNRNAQNALLKILEEPPGKSLLILVTQSMGALIPTIRSRSRLLNLNAPKAGVFTTLMRKYRPDISGPDGELLGRLSGNSAGRALSLLEEGGMPAIREALSLLETLPAMKDADFWQLSEKLAVKGAPDALAGMLDVTTWALREGARSAASGNANARLGNYLATLDALERHRAMCENGNLDRRHMAMGALRILQNGLKKTA